MITSISRGNVFVTGPEIDRIALRYIEAVPPHMRTKRESVFGNHFHVTIATKDELSIANFDKTTFQEESIKDIVVVGLGTARDGHSQSYFVVLASTTMGDLRVRLLKDDSVRAKHFHITLGFDPNDVHSKAKDCSSLITPRVGPTKQDMDAFVAFASQSLERKIDLATASSIAACYLSITPAEHTGRRERLLDILAALALKQELFDVALSIAQQLETISSTLGLLRICQAYVGLGEDVLANFAGLQSIRKMLRAKQYETKEGIVMVKALKVLSNLECPVDSRALFENDVHLNSPLNPWNSMLQSERDDLISFIHRSFHSQNWEHSQDASTNRRATFVPTRNQFHRLPRFFSWLIPQRLCGMSTPRNFLDVNALEEGLNVGLVVSLTIESPLPETWFTSSCRHLFLPVENYEAPTISQVDEFVLASVATMLRSKAVLVHCGGGKGRAGTMLACWLTRMGLNAWDNAEEIAPRCLECVDSRDSAARANQVFCPTEGCRFSKNQVAVVVTQRGWRRDEGMSATDAVRSLRAWRPGSIETQQQEDFVHQYVSELWRREAEGTTAVIDCKPHIDTYATIPYECAPKFANSQESLIIEARQTGVKLTGRRMPSLVVLVGLPGSGKSTFSSALASTAMIISGDEAGGREAVEQAIGQTIKSAGPSRTVIVDRCHPDRKSRERVLELAFHPSDAVAIFIDVDKDECIKRADSRINHPTVESGSGRGIVETFAKMLEPPKCSEGFARVYHVKSKRAMNELLESVFNVAQKAPTCMQVANTTRQNNADKHRGSSGGDDEAGSKPLRLPGFFKFPRTAHLIRMSEKSVSRDDLLIDNPQAWLMAMTRPGHRVVVEEKIDGANLGLSLDPETFQLRAQNRSHYVSGGDHPQFSPLKEWIATHQFEVRSLLDAVREFPHGEEANVNPILFGEWIVAKHSIHYDAIPDYFIAFDILLSNGRFASRRVFHALLDEHAPSLARVPTLLSSEDGVPITPEVLRLAVENGKASFRKDGGSLEGVYLRIDQEDFLKDRAKIVRADFIAGNEHWTKHSVQRNTKLF